MNKDVLILKANRLVALVFGLSCAGMANSQTSSLPAPLISDAQAAIKSAPEESIRMFDQVKNDFSTYSLDSQIAWYTVAIEASNAQFKIEQGYTFVKTLYQNYWTHASVQTKQFISAQFGRYGSINGDLASATNLFLCALNYSDDENSRLRSLNNLAIVYIQNDDWDRAKETYLSGIELAKVTSNQRVLAAMNNNLGHIWFEKKDAEKAQEAFKTAYVIKTRLGQKSSRLLSLHNLMQSILVLKDWPQWDLYYPLYQRLVDEYDIAELSAQRQWMLAYRQWHIDKSLPSQQNLDDLVSVSKDIENPSSKSFINGLAEEMGLQQPIDTQPQIAKAQERIAFLQEVSLQCSLETTGE